MKGSNGGYNGSRPKLSPEQVQDAVDRRAQDPPEPWTSIARDLGVTVPAVIYRVQHATAVEDASAVEAPSGAERWEACTDEDLAALLTVARHGGQVGEVRVVLEALGLLPGRIGVTAGTSVSDPHATIAS